jgi:hypothetical protein
MSRINFGYFFKWRLLLALAFIAIVFHSVLSLIEWSLAGAPLELNWGFFIEFVITYANMLIIGAVDLALVNWLNKKIMWSPKTAVLRFLTDFTLFTIITVGWIILVNQVIFYLTTDAFLSQQQLVYLTCVGLFVNLFFVPVIELVAMMNIQHESELNNKQLIYENTRFKYEILKNQINPHFLFNSLSVLNSLIGSSPEKAKQYVNSFSSVLRHVLAFRESNSIELIEEKAFLEDYVYLLKKRFGNAFNVQIDFDAKHIYRHILPMVLQLLVENVVKHNKMSEDEPMLVNIISTDKGIEVSNPIREKSSTASWGIGLKNIEMRYASLGHKMTFKKDHNCFLVFVPYI